MKKTLEQDKELFEEIINKLKRMNANANKQLIEKMQSRLDRVVLLLQSMNK